MSPRILLTAVPAAAATFVVLGSSCAQSAHPFLLNVGVVHADAACASGASLGPSALQTLSVTALLLLAVTANSTFVRDAVDAVMGRIGQQPVPVRVPPPPPVSATYRAMATRRSLRAASSRDPPSAW